jgi:serine/threonine protein kinase
VLDFGESPEPYLALEYIEGTTVARVLKVCAETQQRLPHAVAAFLIAEVATGLDYAHRRCDDAGKPCRSSTATCRRRTCSSAPRAR